MSGITCITFDHWWTDGWAACWSKWDYNIRSSVLSYPFYIIAYTLDIIFRFILICMHMAVWHIFSSLVLCLHSIHPPLGDYQWDCKLKRHALIHRYVPYCEGKQSNLVSSNVDSFLSWNPNIDPLLRYNIDRLKMLLWQ